MKTKSNGHALRRERWKYVNFNNNDAAIAKFLGVTSSAVREQRASRGIEPWHARGGNYHRQRPYKPLTEGQLRRRGLIPPPQSPVPCSPLQ